MERVLKIFKAVIRTAIFSILYFAGFFALAQDPQFSQYYATPLYTNPALTAAYSDINFWVSYRSRTLNQEFPNDIGQFSAIVPLKMPGSEAVQLGGVGATFFQDQAGPGDAFKTTGAYISGAYRQPLNFDRSEVLLFGIQAGFIQKSIDFSNLTWGQQFNRFIGFDNTITPEVSQFEENKSYPVINAGVMYYFNPNRTYVLYTGSAFGGISVSNINNPDESLVDDDDIESALPLLYRGHTGIEFFLTPQLKWSPQLLVLYQNTRFQFNAGTYFSYPLREQNVFDPKTFELLFGLWYRWDDAAIVSFGLNSTNYTIGFSYDFNTSDLRYDSRGNGGAFEVSLNFRIANRRGLRNFSTPLI